MFSETCMAGKVKESDGYRIYGHSETQGITPCIIPSFTGEETEAQRECVTCLGLLQRYMVWLGLESKFSNLILSLSVIIAP